MENVNQLRLEQIKKDQQATKAKSERAKGKVLALYRKVEFTRQKRLRAEENESDVPVSSLPTMPLQ
jgi:hypothetical protein